MKKHLLSLALLAGLVSSASAEEFYVIKDGKIATGVEVLEFEDPLDGPKVEETTSPDGKDAVSITHQLYCTEARFYVANGIDLNKAWNVEIEYYFEAVDSVTHSGANKWQIIDLGLHSDTVGNRYSLDKVTSDNTFNVKNKAKANTWNVEQQFVYSPASITNVKEIIFGWQRQIGSAGKPNTDDILALKPVYIKNLKFVGEGNKPFFFEDFEGFSSISAEAATGLNYYVVNEGEVIENSQCGYLADVVDANPFKCETPWYTVQNPEGKTYANKQVRLDAKRLYEDEGTDGSEFYDTEILHALDIVLPTNTGKRSAAGLNGRAFTLIPTKGLEATKEVTMQFLLKWDASRSKSETFAEDPDSLIIPIYYAFVDDAIAASTVELSAANQVTSESLASMWTEYTSKFAFDASKKYLALIFDKAPFLSYACDNIRLTSDAVKAVDVVTGVYPIGVTEYKAAGDVENISNTISAIVSPVPATDVITVNNEGVVSVEVVNALGSVVAKAEGNQVNVANLAEGLYIVKAQTVNGVATAKIIKK